MRPRLDGGEKGKLGKETSKDVSLRPLPKGKKTGPRLAEFRER